MPSIVLSVAEKPSIAKTIANTISAGNAKNRPGFSKFNPCYEFCCSFSVAGLYQEQEFRMVVTSVSGHLMQLDFDDSYRSWRSCEPESLFEAPVQRTISKTNSSQEIAKTLTRESKNACMLIIWTDNDREGEAIGQEIVEVCHKANPRLHVRRARFSVANKLNLWNALRSLTLINGNDVSAVAARNEIDLRLGAAFTRFQSLGIQSRFPQLSQNTVSFGSCQFPTLGFVVDRAEEIRKFVSEPFWSIQMVYKPSTVQEGAKSNDVNFFWDRQRLFDHQISVILYELCLEAKEATVTGKNMRRKTKWAPLPLSTVELQVRSSKFLRMDSATTMSCAEKLYQKGIISYPRTETDSFEPSFDARGLVEQFRSHSTLGMYASCLLDQNRFRVPRKGKNNDHAHPPIYPTKCVEPSSISDDKERRIYELVLRHFLACTSRDAIGAEGDLRISMGGEDFHAKGLEIHERNYLDVYVYDRWEARQLPNLEPGDKFTPSSLCLSESMTSPPPYLTEVDLIRLMHRHGIGTDATIQDHIKTLFSREYISRKGPHLVPSPLGYALIIGYKEIGHADTVAKPHMRAEMERDFKSICEGNAEKDDVVRKNIQAFREVYKNTLQQANLLYQAIQKNFQVDVNHITSEQSTNTGGQEHATLIPSPLSFPNIDNYTVRKKGFSRCGKCKKQSINLSQMTKPGPPGPRGGATKIALHILVCTGCDTLFNLPQGKPTPVEHMCAICDTQVVLILKEQKASKGYNICPKCWNTKTAIDVSSEIANHDMEDILTNQNASIPTGVPCFMCAHPTCALSGGRKLKVHKCSSCGNGNVFLRKLEGGRFVLSCDRYKVCSGKSVFLNDGITSATLCPPSTPSTDVEWDELSGFCSSCNTVKLEIEMKSADVPLGYANPIRICPKIRCQLTQNDLRYLLRESVNSFSSSASSDRVAEKPVSSQKIKSSIQNNRTRERKAGPGMAHAHDPGQSFSGVSRSLSAQKSVSAPLCSGHKRPCRRLQSKKDNANKGRYFYKCSNTDGQCNHFEWEEQNTPSSGAGPVDGIQNLVSNHNQISSNNAKSEYACYSCGKPGHFANACPG